MVIVVEGEFALARSVVRVACLFRQAWLSFASISLESKAIGSI